MIRHARCHLLLVLAVVVLAAGAIVPAGTAAAAPLSGGITPTKAPWVSRIWMSRGPSTGGNQVLVYGHHLAGVTSVRFGGVNATNLVVVDDSKLSVTAPPHAAGSVRLRVISPAGSTPPNRAYLYVEAPTIAGVSPATGSSDGGTTVTVTGTGFSNPDAPVVWVKFGGVKGTNVAVQNDTTLTVTAPAHVAANVRVRVALYPASSERSSAARYTYLQGPTVTQISPSFGRIAGGDTVAIEGSTLSGVTSVTFDGIPGTNLNVIDDTVLVIDTPAHGFGAVDVVVTSPNGSDTGVDAFAYTPTISSKSPYHGPTSGGTSVTIAGTSFTGATAVLFDTTPVSFVVNSDNQITAISPPHASGFVSVTIVTPNGTVIDPANTYPWIYD